MKKDLGYGLLLKRYTPNVADATEAQFNRRPEDSIPRVAPLYFAFRIMVACGFLLLGNHRALFSGVCHPQPHWREKIGFCAPRCCRYSAAVDCCRSGLVSWLDLAAQNRGLSVKCCRQLWRNSSQLTAGDLIFSMVLICGLSTLFLVAELFLMFKIARLGPSGLKTGRYHFEQSSTSYSAGTLRRSGQINTIMKVFAFLSGGCWLAFC